MAFKTRQQAIEQLRSYNDQHTLTIQLADSRYIMKSSELGATRDTTASVEAAYRIGRNSVLPALGVVSSLKGGNSGYAYRLDSTKLSAFTRKALADVGRPPVNAKVEVVEGQPVAIADQDGVSIDQAQLGRTLQLALAEGQDKSVSLKPTVVKAEVRLADTEAAIVRAKQLITLDLSLKYNDKTYKPAAAAIAQWLVFPVKANDKGVRMVDVDIDEAKLRGYVQSVANEVNVAPTNKKVTIKNGVTTVEREGKDGLAINQEEAAALSLAALRKQQSAVIATERCSSRLQDRV
jgi:vancomycin resistance protein YoaR